jgi:hypothetical protein
VRVEPVRRPTPELDRFVAALLAIALADRDTAPAGSRTGADGR